MIKYTFIAFIVLFQLVSFSQNEGKKWYFGSGTGIDFSTTPPSTIAVSSMTTQEGCASIADAFGGLLFYTNGVTIWDRTHGVMANGTGLLGSVLSSQSSLILQRPGSNIIYYVFTNVGFNIPNVPNVNYSIVDMSLAMGNGSVVTKNAVLSSDQNTEVITATRHCNGIDWWIVTHIRSSNVFLSYLLTSTGITPGFTVSPTGPNILNGPSQLKISPNGKKIALNYSGAVYLGDFNSATGQVLNVNSIQQSASGYGCEFSPDGGKLYTTAANGIIQYNLCQLNIPAITSSSIMVHSQVANFGSMQLAPNGKIYLSYNNFTTSCHVINNPNASGAACGFSMAAHNFFPKNIHAGLPNFPSCMFYQKPTLTPYFYQVSTVYGCYGASFNAILLADTCPAISNTLAMLVWDFDDPLSGANNISYLVNPTHNFSGNGTYNVKLILHYTCGFPSDTITQQIVINDNCLTYNSNSITCSSPGSATITGATGNGPFTFTWLPTNQTGTIAATLNPGSHTVVVTDLSNNYTYSVPINLASLVAYSATILPTNSITCFGGNDGAGAITNIAGGSGNQTYAWVNGTVVSTAQNPTTLTAGNWTTTVTDALTSCNVTSIVTIAQPPALSLTAVASTPSICIGNTLVLTANNAGGTPFAGSVYNYTWTAGPSTQTTVVIENTSGNYVYTVSSSDSHNCLSTATVNVAFVGTPTVAVSNVSICPQLFGVLTASGASTYTWYTASAGSSVSTAFSDNPATTTQYTVVGSALGCTAAVTASIILYPVPVPSFQISNPICEGGSISLNVVGGATYQIAGPALFSSASGTNVLNNLNLNQSGVYSATVSSVNGCSATVSQIVNVNPTPTVTAVGSTVCTTQTISMSANSVPGANYFWFGPQGFTSSLQAPTIANPGTGRTGMYAVQVTAPTGCANQTTVHVQVVNPPSMQYNLTSPTVCAQNYNGSVNTTTLFVTGANAYTLHATATASSSGFTGASAILYALPPFSPTASVIVEGTNGVCSSFSTVVFTVVPNPVVTVLSSTNSICSGQSFTYNCSGANSYTWITNGLNYSTNSNGSSVVFQPSVTTSFSVFGSALGCKSDFQSNAITVYALPTITISALSSSICLYESTQLSVKGSGTSYQWLPGNGLNTTTGTLVTCATEADRIYTVIATVNNCTRAATASVHVWPLPTPTITGAMQKVCLYDTLRLSAEGGDTYTWKAPDKTELYGNKVAFRVTSPSMGGDYTLTIRDINSCKSTSTTLVKIFSLPSGALLDVKDRVCVPYCADYQFKGNNSASIQATWVVESKTISANSFSHCFKSVGNFTLSGRMYDPETGCKSTLNYPISTFPTPNADFYYSPLSPIENVDQVQFTNSSKGDGTLQTIWYLSEVGTHSFVSNPTYVFTEAGNYPIALVVKNNWGCLDTALKVIKVEPDFGVFVPNSFTPNNDGINDVFKAVVRSEKLFSMKIYDRWGQEVFYVKASDEAWDGSFRGEPCKQDTYTWVIELTSAAGQRLSKTGTVLLWR